MDLLEVIRRLLAEWRQFTLEEGSAISKQCWEEVTKCQAAKDKLTQQLSDAGANWDSQRLSVQPWRELFKEQLLSLLDLERQNHTVLRDTQGLVQGELDQLQLSGRNLRAVRSSYAQRPQVCWQSYS